MDRGSLIVRARGHQITGLGAQQLRPIDHVRVILASIASIVMRLTVPRL